MGIIPINTAMPPTVTRYSSDGSVSSQESLSIALNDANTQGKADLPSYTKADYNRVYPLLELTHDAYMGSSAWVSFDRVTNTDKATKYLPKESQESADQYSNRLRRSLYINAYKSAVKGFAGLLSNFELSQDAVVTDYENDIDRQSSSFTAFLCDADELVLRDGMCGVLVDYPQRPAVMTLEDERRLNLRPYLVLIERKDILNWQYNDSGELIRVTIRRTITRPMGTFGEETVTQYHVWFPGLKQVWEENEDMITLVDEIPVTLPMVPLVPYSVTALTPFASNPPLLDLALMNFHHYRLYSDYMEVMHKCNLPVPVRRGFMVPGTTDSAALPPVVIGPNTAIDVPHDGDFFFAEPSGAAIASTREAIIDVENAMMKESLAFLGDGGTKTAYEVQLRSSQARASLSLLAEQKESCVEKIFQVWAAWLGVDTVGSIEVSRDLLQEKLEPAIAQLLSEMQTLGQLPLETLLETLRQGRLIPKDVDVEAIASAPIATPENEAIGI